MKLNERTSRKVGRTVRESLQVTLLENANRPMGQQIGTGGCKQKVKCALMGKGSANFKGEKNLGVN